jgi:hypothetical protein
MKLKAILSLLSLFLRGRMMNDLTKKIIQIVAYIAFFLAGALGYPEAKELVCGTEIATTK